MARADILRYASIAFGSGTRLWGAATGELAGFGSGGGAIPAGFYEAKVETFGNVTIGGWPESGASLRIPELVLGINDIVGDSNDASFERMIASGENVLGVPATVGAYFPASGNSQTFVGVLASREQTDVGKWSISIRTDVSALNTPVPRNFIRKGDWPNAGDKTCWGLVAPAIWGVHDSAGISNTGAIPTYYVDSVGYRYLVSFGWVNVTRVYKDGARVTSNFAIAHVVVGGQMWTLIDFVASQGTSTITCDVQGYDSVGDGTGTLITAVGDQLLHFLRNFVYGSPVLGLWQTTGGPLLSSTFTLASLAARAGGNGYAGSWRLTEQKTAVDVIQDHCSFGVFPYFDEAGRLGLMLDDFQQNATTWRQAGSKWLRKSAADFDRLKQVFQNAPLRSVLCNFATLATGGSPEPIQVLSPASLSLNEEPMSLSHGPAFQ